MTTTAPPRLTHRLAALALGAACLLAGLDAALGRLGTWAPVSGAGLAALHGPLMLVGFLGTVIALERAVAARTAWALAAPAGNAAGCLLLLAGAPHRLGAGLATVAALVLLAVYARVHRRAPSHAVDIEAAGALALLLGDLLWLAGAPVPDAVPLWLLFPVLTIVGERLELARVAFLDPLVEETVRGLSTASLLAACALSAGDPLGLPHAALGASLLALAVTMAYHDVARRTVRSRGAQGAGVRHAAACMLAGYAWLALAGATWCLAGLDGLGGAAYETVIHALGVGFAFSMILAHAPTIVPAIVHRRLTHWWPMWVPLVLLHAGLLIRVAGLLTDAVGAWQAGGVLGVVAILLFLLLLTLARSLRGGPLATGRATSPATTASPASPASSRQDTRRQP